MEQNLKNMNAKNNNNNQDLMSDELTIEYSESGNSIIIKDADYKIEEIESERNNQFGNPIFDIFNWNGSCTISKTMRGDYFNLFLKLNNVYYKAFQKVNEGYSITFRNFREVEKIDGKWEFKR
ncbi:MAG: hypothetical protein AM1032_000026 [Mycoplasmataceae bacterium]|nr:MAG: hypothetical protein AM1032_000026 [Mycoplasmataceae bacterium]